MARMCQHRFFDRAYPKFESLKTAVLAEYARYRREERSQDDVFNGFTHEISRILYGIGLDHRISRHRLMEKIELIFQSNL